MQLSEIGKPNPKEFEFTDPYTNNPTGIFVTVHALKSKIGKHATIEMHRRNIELRNNPDNLDEDGNVKLDIQSDLTVELVADLVESWRGVTGENGKPIKPSKEAYIQGFKDSPELLDAVFLFANNLGNFSSKQVKPL